MPQIYFRSVYIAAQEKTLIHVDLSQAESWVVAYLANEPNMKNSLQNSDIHRDTAGNALFFPSEGCRHEWEPIKGPAKCKLCGSEVTKPMRYIGKRFNHASAYRMGPVRASEVINADSDQPPYVTVSIEESKKFNKQWTEYYYIRPWWNEIERKLDKDRTLVTSYGYSRVFFERWGDELFKEATAFIPQSTVADHFNGRIHPQLGIEGGLVTVYRKLVKPSNGSLKIINQSHDSCIIEAPKFNSRDICLEVMNIIERPMVVNGQEFTIPVDGEIGERWGEMDEIKQ